MLDRYIQSEQPVADKEAYKGQAEVLKTRLRALEQEIKAKKLPVIILFEGWGASGKGYVISKTINCPTHVPIRFIPLLRLLRPKSVCLLCTVSGIIFPKKESFAYMTEAGIRRLFLLLWRTT